MCFQQTVKLFLILTLCSSLKAQGILLTEKIVDLNYSFELISPNPLQSWHGEYDLIDYLRPDGPLGLKGPLGPLGPLAHFTKKDDTYQNYLRELNKDKKLRVLSGFIQSTH